MRIIDADALLGRIQGRLGVSSLQYVTQQEKVIIDEVESAPIFKTKQVKYYDEDESVWKIGEVIVNSSEKPNNSTTEDSSDVGKE